LQLGKGNVCNELIAEYNAAGTLLKRYVHGIGSDDPLVSYDGAGTTSPTYLLADERGSIMAETNSAGTVTTKHQYGPYGEPINQSASRFRYTGQILLPGTALYHYKARVYHPKLGRFLQTDPIGYKDGMNWYAYVGNDPMNAVDPDGKSLKLLKAAFNIAKRMLKGDSGKDAIKGEAADFVDNVRTLTDGEFGVDDAIAVVDLATGFGKEAKDIAVASEKVLKPTISMQNPKNLIPTQTKSEMSGSQVKRLTKNMKENGFDESKPVSAWRNPSTGRLEIQDGHHRTAAAIKADLNEIPVEIWE
jgi:RHS repeat-associated protein